MTLIDRINDYYKLEDTNGQISVTANKSSSWLENNIFFDKRDVIFSFGEEITEENIEDLIAQDRIIKMTGQELYQLYFNWTDEEVFFKDHKYDLRTSAYFEAIEDNIGLIKKLSTESPEKLIEVTEAREKRFSNYSFEVGKTKEGHYSALKGEMQGIDALVFTQYLFRKYPTDYGIKTSDLIDDLRFEFRFKNLKESFRCWECGNEVDHWLDLPGNLTDKYNSLKEKFCEKCD